MDRERSHRLTVIDRQRSFVKAIVQGSSPRRSFVRGAA
jgi:hypothetical protein